MTRLFCVAVLAALIVTTNALGEQKMKNVLTDIPKEQGQVVYRDGYFLPGLMQFGVIPSLRLPESDNSYSTDLISTINLSLLPPKD